MHLIDDIVVSLVGRGRIISFAKSPLHSLRLPVGRNTKDLVCVKIDEDTVFSMERQSFIDAWIVLYIFNELPDDPLVGGADSVDGRLRERAGHFYCLVLDKQQVFTKLPDLLFACHLRVPKIKLRGKCTSLDEVGFINVQAECLHCPVVNDLKGSRGKLSVIESGQL